MTRCAVGLVGAGTIGGGVVKIVQQQAEFFKKKLGLDIVLKRVADKNTALFASLPIGDALCSNNADDILSDTDIAVVIELVGGTTFARTLVLRSLEAGKHVITANKALVAEHGPELFEAAARNGVSLYFEASVGGGMPTIKTIREAMIGNDIRSVKTIINGTCNYILTRMEQEGLPFDTVLKQAQAAGFAEADPTLDVGGGDTGHKVAIMASLLYGGYVPYEDIPVEGITGITDADIACAREMGYRIKLLGVIGEGDENGLDVRVHPAMLRTDHILASVMREFNAVLLNGDAVGDIVLYGRGAGELPTASAVISDVIDVARNIESGTPVRISMDYYTVKNRLKVRTLDSLSTRYYLRFTVSEKPRVLAPIAASLGDKGISIASVIQHEGGSGNAVPVIILTHPACEKDLRDALAEIETMEFVRAATQVIRIVE